VPGLVASGVGKSVQERLKKSQRWFERDWPARNDTNL
jgi:hypothetical protein